MFDPSPVVTLIEGEGIGPEVVDAAIRAVEAAGGTIRWEEAEAGQGAERELWSPLPTTTIDSIRQSHLVLKGPLTTPVSEGRESVNVTLRRTFDLYANVRPYRRIPLQGLNPNGEILAFRKE